MDILQQLNQIAVERDLPFDELQRELEEGLAAAYKKFVGAIGEVTVKIDPQKGWNASVQKEVVGIVSEPSVQIGLVEARRRKADAEVGDFIPMDVDPNRFGRIAAQTFKQVLSQKLREAETRRIHDVFNEKMGDVVTGTISRKDGQNLYVQVNKVEAELPRREQVPTEPYRTNDRLKVYVYKVDDMQERLRIIVSRTHPNLLRRLFELEVPEISDGTVIIRNVAREPGQRSKVAVYSTDERVDPIGSCIGPRGSRVQSIVDELYDEKIDVVPYNEDPRKFITDALSPAKVNSLKLNLEEKSAFVIVPDNQLSLAIGKGGQNVRLAARLTEWTIDIKSESQVALERNELSTKARELDAENDAKKPLSPRTGAAPRPAKTPAKSKDKAILCSNGANLDSLFLELDNLIGLTAVKEDISSLANLLKVRAMKQRQGIQTPSPSMHLVLTGNPGTGKTTVARLIGKIYKELGAVSSGHCIEVDRSGLVAGYLGQTAIKVQTILAEARGGVLFIDEAYALAGRSEGDYGNEAIATLAKAMEDHRDDLIVIVAGYQDQMHNFLDSNPGIRSRFNKYIHFPDYSPDELFRIFHAMSKQTGFVIDVAAEDKVKDLLAGLHMLRGQHFGNGRTVRNVFDRVQSLQADRVVRMERPTKADLLRIKAEDVPMDGNFA